MCITGDGRSAATDGRPLPGFVALESVVDTEGVVVVLHSENAGMREEVVRGLTIAEVRLRLDSI